MSDTGRSQDLTEDFCQDPFNREKMLYIENIDSFGIYQEAMGYYKLYAPTSKKFERIVYEFLKKRLKKSLTTSLVKDIVTQIKWVMYRQVEEVTTDYVAFTDKVLNLVDFSEGELSFEKPAFFHINYSLQHIISQANNMPKFQKFLDQIVVTRDGEADRELQKVLQEMFGYALLSTIEGHMAFFLVGDGANGKSVLLNILRKIIGDDFVTTMSIETLTTNKWASSSLVGKRLNICAEEESNFIKADRFKALISGDPISAERKFGDSFVLVPTVKYVFATNEMPSFSTLNQGLTRRIRIIPFNRVIPREERNTKLFEELMAELPGIINWALEGAKRLVANKFVFSECDQTRYVDQLLKETLSSAVMFVNEKYEEDPDAFMSHDELYFNYVAWCEAHGKKKMSSANFVNDLRKVLKLKSEAQWDRETGTTKRGRKLRPKKEIEPPNYVDR